MKTIPFTRLLLSMLAVAMSLVTTACSVTRNETWHCYDTKGRPAEGVLIVCRYGLANYGESAVNFRFSDVTGKIVLNLDKDTPYGLPRGYECIYSSRLRSGAAGLGERWHEGDPIPNEAVYFDEWNNKIYLKSGVDDPLIWHDALNVLIDRFCTLRRIPQGGEKLNAKLSVLAPRERTLFLNKYGEQTVPSDYLKSASVNNTFEGVSNRTKSGIKFKDITLSLPNH